MLWAFAVCGPAYNLSSVISHGHHPCTGTVKAGTEDPAAVGEIYPMPKKQAAQAPVANGAVKAGSSTAAPSSGDDGPAYGMGLLKVRGSYQHVRL